MKLEEGKESPRAREVQHFVLCLAGTGGGASGRAVVGWSRWVEGATFTESRARQAACWLGVSKAGDICALSTPTSNVLLDYPLAARHTIHLRVAATSP